MSKEVLFPEGFVWGASTSAHQVEGGNNNDWSEWELDNAARLASEASAHHDYGNGPTPAWELIADNAKEPENYISGRGVDFYNRWHEDFQLAKDLGLSAIRFSVEWSRVEPAPGVFNGNEVSHYARMVEAAHDMGLEPFITLHHFTSPQWFAREGGFEQPESAERFESFVGHVVPRIATEADNWLVINEPEVYSGVGWMMGQWPPNKHNPYLFRKVNHHLADAHKRGYDIIKSYDEEAQVSSAVNYQHFDPKSETLAAPINRGIARLGNAVLNHGFHKKTIDHQDFIGLNHYMHNVVDMGIFKNPDYELQSDLGWYLNPESLHHALVDLSRYGKPIIITEHGLADKTDTYREWYLSESLRQAHRAIEEGVDLRGYLHWSLLDNFEWDKGYWPQFGLVQVDRDTMKRTIRESAQTYAKIAVYNGLPEDV